MNHFVCPLLVIYSLVICPGIVFLSSITAFAQEERTWTSSDQKFRMVATFVSVSHDGSQVTLKKADGSELTIELEKLSTADQAWVRNQREPDGDDESSNVNPGLMSGLTGAELGATLEQRFLDYHQGQKGNGEVLRVVYFHGSDARPQRDYQNRLQRVMEDIQNFYLTEMRRNGFENAPPMPLEIENNRLAIHVVSGKNKTSGYTGKDGQLIKRECKQALRGTVDFETDFVIIFCGLLRKKDGQYIFHAPNYGLPSNHIRGCCLMPDSEMFDAAHQSNTQTRIKYKTNTAEFNERLAKYTSKRIGGTAHELGHALNLPHNAQLPREEKRLGKALMGIGNYAYRKDTWMKDHSGAFMTLASCLQLAAHPLFTGSDKGRQKAFVSQFDNIQFSINDRNRIRIQGVAEGDPKPLAVIAYVDSAAGNAGYDANTWVAGIEKDGSFDLVISEHGPGTHELRLMLVHLNGATRVSAVFQYSATNQGRPPIETLNNDWTVRSFESLLIRGLNKQAIAGAELALETASTELYASQLRHVIALASPQDTIALSDVEGDSVFLSDVQWERGNVGLGEPVRNRFYINPNRDRGPVDRALLNVGGNFHEKGLYAHSNSTYVFDLDGQWEKFRAVAGLQAGAPGRCLFVVRGDGRELFASEKLEGSETENVVVSVRGVSKLELIAKSHGKQTGGCWSIWASPKLER